MKVIVINGGKRRGRVATLLKTMGFPIYHLSDGIEVAVRRIKDADTVLFATPVYWFNVSARMKELIDALPEGPHFPLEGKTAYLLAFCDEDGGQQAVNQMFAPLSHMGFQFPPYASYFRNSNAKTSEGDWQRKGLSYIKKQIEKSKS